MSNPLAELAKLGTADHRAIGTLRDAGLDVEVVAVEQAPAPAPAPATGQPGQIALDVDQAAGEELDLLGYVEQLLTDYERTRPRSTQVALGPSEIGHPCRRNISLKLARFPEAEGELAWAPLQGVAMHALMEEVLAFDNAGRPGSAGHVAGEKWIIEGEVEVDENIRGHSDAFLIIDDRVVDWKYAGSTATNKLRAGQRRGDPPAKQVGQEYRVQGHLYGYAVRRKGRDVRKVSIVFLARSYKFSDSAVWTEEYREDVAQWAITRYYDIVRVVQELGLAEHHDRWNLVPASPGPDACKWCPFRNNPCPGDVAAAESSATRFGSGLI